MRNPSLYSETLAERIGENCADMEVSPRKQAKARAYAAGGVTGASLRFSLFVSFVTF